jgi:hypothetical protein
MMASWPPPVGSPVFLRLKVAPNTLSYTQAFNTLASSGTNPWVDDSTLAGWYADKTVYVASSGGANAGTMASYGTSSSDTERALGGVPALATPITIARRYVNDTGGTVDVVDISYMVEQWRQDSGPNSQVNLEYQVFEPGTGSLSAAGYTALLSVTPSVEGPSGSINGNENQTPQAISLNGLGLMNGQELWLRWTFAKTGGPNINLAIDDLEVAFNLPE